MITLPTQQELTELQEFDKPFCLTIYAPLITPNTPTNPNRILLKNLLREAKIALSSAGIQPHDITKTLKPAHTLIDDPEFWTTQHECLALFLHPKLFRHYYIPDGSAPYELSVDTGFKLEPLLKVMQDNQHYYVLALGHKNVHLYEGDHHTLTPIHLKNLPDNMNETLHIDEYPQSRETHSVAPASSGKGSQAFHQQYNVSQTDKDMLLEFFRRIDSHLHNFLSSHHKPLIIAGVNYLIPIYRKVNTYPGLLDKTIPGNQDHVDLRTIRENAWQIIKS